MEIRNKNVTLGIDIGSTTVKIAILDADHNILFSDYERHYAIGYLHFYKSKN